HGAARAEVHL
nr:Chain C, Histone-lysine N-methyltransferase MLL [Homo sapiens]